MSSNFMRLSDFCFLLVLLFGSVAGSAAQTVTISPGWVSIGVGGTMQYTAAVNGLTNSSVTWLVNGVAGGNSTTGTVSANGLYTAPAQVPAFGITIWALASDNQTYGINYINIAATGPAITGVVPNPVPVGTYTLTLTGSGFRPGVRVLADGIPQASLYINSTTIQVFGWQGQAAPIPFQVANSDTLYGQAFSVPFGKITPQTVSPTSATVNLSATQQFASPGATSWAATAGSISLSGLYTAPATMPLSSSVTIKATGPNGTASAIVTLLAQQTISPVTASVNLGGTLQFASAGATSWTTSAGTVSATGLYTAPTALPASGPVTVTALGGGSSATATITLVPPSPVITMVGTGALPLGIFSTTISGTGFINGSVASINGIPMATTFANGSLSVTGFSGQSGAAAVNVSNGTFVSASFPVQVGVQNPLVSAAAARRFLEQAAFGPTPSDATHVQTVGFPAWLNEQFAMPQISDYDTVGSQGGMPAHFLAMAVTNQDQLRQRIAFALSQIFVTSLNKLIWNDNMIAFQDILLADSLLNYRQIMGDVTLSSAMGQYLDMANNAQANPTTGSVANENYARELMQLFTIGTNQLNPDGSTKLDGNSMPVPTYSQFTITEFARVYTGWTYAPRAGQPVVWNALPIYSQGPMVAFASEHDFGSKQLLSGASVPAGLAPLDDLNSALDNIFNHPNVGPFVGKLLIQHLVKSNPSPAYVARVAAAFNDNGKGVRGDMQAVVSAILLDPEARANDEGGKDLPTDGHLQEPALYMAGMVRAFGGQMNDQNWFADELSSYGEPLFNSPSVFNFFSPSYGVPGTTLSGPEFQINTPNNAIVRANEAGTLAYSQWSNPVQSYGPGTSVDFTPFLPLAATPATLVDALDLTLTHGVMPATMKSQIVAAVTADTWGALHQVQTACYLILTSSYYNVWH